MKILWFSWKDLNHPLAGGAEVVNEELAKRLVKDGHEVTFVVGNYKSAKAEEVHKDGYKIIRLGNRVTVYWQAYRYYKKHLQGWADLVIDEINTIPFFCKFYVKERNVVFAHGLCGVVWYFELPEPLSSIGYFIEPLYLRLLKDRSVITVSESTKKDMVRVGFSSNNINIISEGIDTQALKYLPSINSKTKAPTVLSLGAMRPMKQTMDQLKAFEMAKKRIPNLKFSIVGDSTGTYGKKVLDAIKKSPFAGDITYHGRVNQADKYKLMRESRCILVTSVKEGWGLIVTEANSQGTPAVVYNVDGLRDSVRDNRTGLITKQNNPDYLARSIIKLLSNQKKYEALRREAWTWSKTITFKKSYQDFSKIVIDQ
jgi:glycosyltransferase involved in cell wall biosynthesis